MVGIIVGVAGGTREEAGVDDGVAVVKTKDMKTAVTCALSREDVTSRVILVSVGGSGTRNRIVSVRRKADFHRPVSVITKSCPSTTSSSVIVVASNVTEGPKRAHVRLARAGIGVVGGVAPRVMGITPGTLCVVMDGPYSVVACTFTGLSKLPRGRVLNSKATLSATHLHYELSRRCNMSRGGVRTCMFKRRKSASFMP